MAKDFGKLYVAIDCSNCGVHGEGEPAENGKTRCGKCGQYGEKAENYCVEHDVHYAGLYPEDNHCPMCREEQRIEEQRQEMHERRADPDMHHSVDARRR